jgi:hypothetical protein
VNTSLQKWGLDPSHTPPPVLASEEPIVRFFSYHEAHPVAITIVLLEKFGVDWFEWEPEALKSEILQTFKATSVSEHNWQKIQAIRTLTRSTNFWEEWSAFEKVIQALNNNIPRFDIAQRCTMSQMMAGVDIANQIRDESYAEEVQRYIAACSLDEGVTYLPSPLDFAQRILSSPMYRCKICGNIDADDLDGRCDFCTGRFTDEHPLNFKPNPKLPGSVGREIERYLLRDPSVIEARYKEVLAAGYSNVKFDDNSNEDVQALKLVVASEYMNDRRKQLVDQLEELKSWVTH